MSGLHDLFKKSNEDNAPTEVWVTHQAINEDDATRQFLLSVDDKPWPTDYDAPITTWAANTRYVLASRTPDPAQIRADALREALAIAEYMANRNCMAADVARDLKRLIATPLSPTAVDNSPAPDAGGNDDPAVYLIRKYGGYYRPNCQGYTRFKEEAGRYTLAKAIRESHPNGPDGPRDGMTYIHEDDVGPLDAGGKEGV